MNETTAKLRRNATRSLKTTEYSKPHPSGRWTLDAAQKVQWPILDAMCLWPLLYTTCLLHALHTACPGHTCQAPTGHHASVRGQVMWMGALKDRTRQGGLVGPRGWHIWEWWGWSMHGVTWVHAWGCIGPCMWSHGSMHGVTWVHAWGHVGPCMGSRGSAHGVT